MNLIAYNGTDTVLLGLSFITIIIICFVIQIVFFVVCANIMVRKGHSPLTGVFLGFFLGFVGLIICLFIAPKDDYYQRRSYRGDNYRNRPRLRPRGGKINHPRTTGRTGYRPVSRLRNPNSLKANVPQEAIPKTQETKQVACPHCSAILYVSVHTEYTCPNCEKPFNY